VRATAGGPAEGAVFGRGIWRFGQLVAVGFAWSAPLLPAVFIGFELGTPAHPQLARIYAPHGWLLLAATLLLASLGIGLVAATMRRPARVRPVWLLVPAAVALVAVAPFVAPGSSYAVFFAFALAALAIPLLVVALGVYVTVLTLWRRARWLGIAWLAGWLATAAFLVYSTTETADSGGPADGLVIMPVLAALLFVVLFVAMLASVLSGVSDWEDHARRIEQAHQPDAPNGVCSNLEP
jgi:hypothetical protein